MRTVWVCIQALMLLGFAAATMGLSFSAQRSTVLLDEKGQLLSAAIAEDGQWRFPESDSVPWKFRCALIEFEDRHFLRHNGVDFPSLVRAVVQNAKAGSVVSGGSTLTMQVARLGNKHDRNVWYKLVETMQALRMECVMSKEEIIAQYAHHAPYGGNVVGLEAASWRYFGRSADALSWAESATLAILPNAPALIHPGRNREALKAKRDRLLHRLYKAGYFDTETLELGLKEPLPEKPYPLPQDAQHLLFTAMKHGAAGTTIHSTLDGNVQRHVAELVERHADVWRANGVNNAAVLVVDVASGETMCYIGNTYDAAGRFGNNVDVVMAPRSTGSILKPFLYAAMLDEGRILPHSLVPDVPVLFDGFSPQNYSETFDGAVPASAALSRSLNIPAVLMLKEYHHARFQHVLQRLGFAHFTRPADDYGLTMVLGGGEATLWEICHAYAEMARQVNDYPTRRDATVVRKRGWQTSTNSTELSPVFTSGATYTTFQSLLEVNRPESELGWEEYSSTSPIAWKTGTSFGNRDAWAVGTTPQYVVGVWVGNADGSGRPGLTGVTSAAPLMFDVFRALPRTSWFAVPYDNLVRVPVCKSSGKLAIENCGGADTAWVPQACAHGVTCDAHPLVHLDVSEQFRVTSDCYDVNAMQTRAWFTLPPVQAYYYKKKHPDYLDQPPYLAGCEDWSEVPMGWIYPKGEAVLQVPRNLQGKQERIVLEVAHRRTDAVLYWHLDDEFVGTTRELHQMEVQPNAGVHVFTVTDDQGFVLKKRVTVR